MTIVGHKHAGMDGAAEHGRKFLQIELDVVCGMDRSHGCFRNG